MIDNEYIVIGSEDECRSVQRPLDFGGDKIEDEYIQLFPEYQRIVLSILKELVGSHEYFGYNLEQVIKYFSDKKVSQPDVSQLKLCKQIYSKREVDFYRKKIKSLTKNDFKKLIRDPKSSKSEDILKYPYDDLIENLIYYVPQNIMYDLYKEYSDRVFENFPDNVPELKLHELLEYLPIKKLQYIFEKSLADFEEKSIATIQTSFDKAKTRVFCPQDEGSDIQYNVDMFCQNYLISIDVIKNGFGKCFSIDAEWINKINADEDFQNYLSDFQWQGSTTLSYYKEYEKFLWKKNKLDKNKSIFIVKYAVLKKIGLFCDFIEKGEIKKSKINQYNAICALIKELKVL